MAIARQGNTIWWEQSGSSWSQSYTVSSGTDRCLVVRILVVNQTVSSMSYNGVALTKITSRVNGAFTIEIWALTGPATGSNTLSITLNGNSVRFHINASDYTDVDQDTPTTASGTNTGSSTTPTITVNSTSTDYALDIVVAHLFGISGCSQTSDGYNNVTGFSHKAGASPNVTLSWTLSYSDEWDIAAASLKQAQDVVPAILTLQNVIADATLANIALGPGGVANLTLDAIVTQPIAQVIFTIKIPAGIIIGWPGTVAAIPAHWLG